MNAKVGAIFGGILAILLGSAAALSFVPTLSPMPCPPPSMFTWNEGSLTVTFTLGTGCYQSVTWDFGDGGSGSGTPVTHTFATQGTYTVTASVLTNTNSLQIIPEGVPVTLTGGSGALPPDFSWYLVGYNLLSGFLYQFNVTRDTNNYPNYLYKWDFGDGTPQVTGGLRIQHTYHIQGNYSVTLFGVSGQITHTVGVFPPPPPPPPPGNQGLIRLLVAASIIVVTIFAVVFVPLPILGRVIAGIFGIAFALVIYLGVLPV